MKRGFLRWFYIGVQFVMLAVSIPKVATLFHAYDPADDGAADRRAGSAQLAGGYCHRSDGYLHHLGGDGEVR